MTENNKNYWGMAMVLILVVIAAIQGYIATKQVGPTITVVSSGSVKIKPEVVTLVVTRATLGNSAEESITLGDIAMTKIVEAVKRMMGEGVEINKSFYQVTPQADGKFLMAQAISVKSTNIASTGNLIKYLYANGATTISNISFGPADEKSLSVEAENEAIKNAKEMGQNLVSGMGKKLGKVVSVVDDNSGMTSSIGEGAYVGTDIKEISLEKKVSVVFEVK